MGGIDRAAVAEMIEIIGEDKVNPRVGEEGAVTHPGVDGMVWRRGDGVAEARTGVGGMTIVSRRDRNVEAAGRGDRRGVI